MKRALRLISFCLILCLLFADCAFAHDRKGHNRELEQMLLNTNSYKTGKKTDDKRILAINAIETAAAFSIDQFGTSPKDQATNDIKCLKDYGVRGVPSNVAEINPANNENLTATTHRSSTHRGWDYNYPIDKANWALRKKILVNTCLNVFGEDAPYESLAALVYYLHILGDYIEDKNFHEFNGNNGLKIPFVVKTKGQTADIFSEIRKHLQIIFADQSNTRTYNTLMSQLSKLESESRKIVSIDGGVSTEEQFIAIHDCIEKLMALLCRSCDITEDETPCEERYHNRINTMLKKEAWFTKVFYS